MEIINFINEIISKYFYLIIIIFFINISIDISTINKNTKKIKQLLNNEPEDPTEKNNKKILENLEEIEK